MKNHVAFITGANSLAGIGFATAKAFAQKGVHIAIMGRREEQNKRAQHALESFGIRCLTFAGDVTQEEQVMQALATTFDTFGALHYAFNNAGIEQQSTPLSEQTCDDYQRIMDINVKGVWLCLKHQIPYMLKTGQGAIVNTSSIAGLIGMAQIPLYIASKHAVIGLTKAIALEYAKDNIRVNTICPGVVETDIYQRFVKNEPVLEAQMQTLHPIGRTGQPDEIANAVVWLCSSKASFITGTALPIDGGFTAQ